MIKEDAIKLLVEVIKKGKRHVNYAKNVDRAKLYHTLATGEDAESLLKLYARRENKELFDQRVAITQHIFTTTTKSIMDVFYKVPRALYNRILAFKDDDSNLRLKELEDILSKYYGDSSLDDWMGTRYLDLNAFDPNTFIVEEFESFDNRVIRAKPYPFEVSSGMAIDYLYKNNVLQYLIVEQKKEKLLRYTIYTDIQSIVLQQVDSKDLNISDEDTIVQYFDKLYISINKNIYEYIEPLPYNLGRVPARQVGIVRAKQKSGDDNISYLSLFDAAIPFIKKSIKTNSELDLVMSNMAFPIKISYVHKCNECEGFGKVNDETCGECHGTGKIHPTSSMETIEIGMNGNLDNESVIDLNKMVAFVSPPTDIIKIMDEYVDKMVERAKEIVFNSDIFTKKQISDTATGKILDSQNVYDALQPVFRSFSDMWEHKIDVIRLITDLNNNLIRSFTFNKDAKLKSKTELFSDLTLLNSANASPEFRRDVYNDIARITYSDNPNEYLRYQVRERFNPFSGYSQESITQALLSEFVRKEIKVLYYNFNYIFNEVEHRSISKGKDFYSLNYELQKQEIDVIVSEIIDQTKTTVPIL